ncbi:hypothetical protein [Streptomyces sp. RPT161]|uniref:hypothetical protein n=1 Tax=Streptomyces sp. RPT161 TaxID=3015993 RepID=UPI0022B89D64|nr:hypothetical protein [Streptomyces sp. RPT161]
MTTVVSLAQRAMNKPCETCGRAVGDPEASGPSPYCYDCGRYIEPTSDSPLQAEYDYIARTAPDEQAAWLRDQFHLVSKETSR